MIINFTELRPDGSQKNYSWWFNSLEASLDVLSSLGAKGRRIIQAEWVEQEHRVGLPVDIFDGTSFTLPFHQLEDQWTRILTDTAPSRCGQPVEMKRV
ncbi:hypothetical protein [Spirosoma pulveris]